MKKIILSVALALTFSVCTTAQEMKSAQAATLSSTSVAQNDTRSNSKTEVLELMKITDLKNEAFDGVYELFEYKNKVMSNPNSSPEKKTEFIVMFNDKLRSIVGEKSFEKLKANRDFYNQITADPSIEVKRTK